MKFERLDVKKVKGCEYSVTLWQLPLHILLQTNLKMMKTLAMQFFFVILVVKWKHFLFATCLFFHQMV